MFLNVENQFLRELCKEQQEEIDRLNAKLDEVLKYLEQLKGSK